MNIRTEDLVEIFVIKWFFEFKYTLAPRVICKRIETTFFKKLCFRRREKYEWS